MSRAASYSRASFVTGGGEVSGAGPSGDPAAVARIQAQFPVVPGDTTLSDAQALSYISRLSSVVPQFKSMATVSKCAVNHGLVGVKAYLRPNLSRAGAIVVVSRAQAQQIAAIAAKCFLSEVTGGGPRTSGGFEPCFASYSIDNVVNGVGDRYYVFTGGTDSSWCDLVKDYHRNFNVQPIGS